MANETETLALGSKWDGKTIEEWSCARDGVGNEPACDKRGALLCSKCHQVKYCSKDCQTSHWRQHKTDCNSRYAKDDWVPGWIKSGNPPAFIKTQPGLAYEAYGDVGRYFWGNTPAYDCLQWESHEGIEGTMRDIALFFAASGDLRNVVTTVNRLPSDYQGTCKVFINDITDYVSVRNLIFLCMLCDASGPPIADVAEAVLHLWYSSPIKPSHAAFLDLWMNRLFPGLKVPNKDWVLNTVDLHGPSKLTYSWPRAAVQLMVDLSHASYSLDQSNENRRKIRSEPSRVDYRDRRICGLLPRHRSAVQHWLKTGVLLPFGESVTSFSRPNRFLFAPDGKWLLPDSAYILDGWDPIEVEATRRQLKLPSEDLYGSLFFHIKKELAEFAGRTRRLNLDFTFTSQDMRVVGMSMEKASSLRFDRIDASNVLDTIGPTAVIASMAPLLNRTNPRATLFMYSMNWPQHVPNSIVQDKGKAAVEQATKKVLDIWTTDKKTKKLHPTAPPEVLLPFSLARNIKAFHDTEADFLKFLSKFGVDETAKQNGLRRRKRPSIHPARLALPIPKTSGVAEVDAERLYMFAEISVITWLERFLEFEVASDT